MRFDGAPAAEFVFGGGAVEVGRMAAVHLPVPMQSHDQNFHATGPEAGQLRSHTYMECTLAAHQRPTETITFCVQVCTKVGDLRGVLCAKLGYIELHEIEFIIKQGCTFKKMHDSDQVARRMTVRGVKNFRSSCHEYPHPYGIIGCGYNGIKTALFLLHSEQTNFMVFDRYDRCGGHCWLECANRTTRLQTEFAAYHVWYGPEWSTPESTVLGPPTEWEMWPTADRILEHFQLALDKFGIASHCVFNTEVESTDLCGKISDPHRFYNLNCQPKRSERRLTQGGGAQAHQITTKLEKQSIESSDPSGYHKQFVNDPDRPPFAVQVSCFALWPGNLTNPRQVIYKGEDMFGGACDYGIEMRVDYACCTGKNCIIVGHGAFTMENIRTCCEHGAKHIYTVCRKRNLTCPRVVSWFINQAEAPLTAAHTLRMLEVAYKYCGYNPWDMHSVTTNSSRTHATFNQKSRFGIGDIYFLSCAYGIQEIVVDTIKRLTYRTAHLESSRKLDDVDVILKCTGMLPDWTVDRVLKCKFLKGYWVNGDPRRTCCADPDGIAASNFGGTTIGPGAYDWTKTIKHFWDVPNDWQQLEDSGMLGMLPSHSAGDPDPDMPAYFIDARHATGTSMTVHSISTLLSEKCATDSRYKHWLVNYVAPTERFVGDSKKDWEHYERMFRDKGMVPEDAPYVPYPYTCAYVEEQHEEGRREQEAKYAMHAAKAHG